MLFWRFNSMYEYLKAVISYFNWGFQDGNADTKLLRVVWAELWPSFAAWDTVTEWTWKWGARDQNMLFSTSKKKAKELLTLEPEHCCHAPQCYWEGKWATPGLWLMKNTLLTVWACWLREQEASEQALGSFWSTFHLGPVTKQWTRLWLKMELLLWKSTNSIPSKGFWSFFHFFAG